MERMVENLRAARKAKGMSQQQLADAIGVSQQAIHQYETDKIEPDIENLKRLADALDVSVDFLVNHETLAHRSFTVVSDDEFTIIEHYRNMNVTDKRFVKKFINNMVK